MTSQTALAVAAALVALAFSMCTFERWLERRRPQDLAWSVALALFTAGAAALWLGATDGWDGPTFRAFWLFGAVANVPALALGTVYLLTGRRAGHRWALAVGLFVAFAVGVVVAAPFTAPVPADRLPKGSEVFGPVPRVLAAVSSGGGALVILAGALWSVWRHRRGRMVVANLLIALGTLVLSASGLLNSVVGEMDAFSITLTVGITILFAGFLTATTARTPKDAAPRPPPETARQTVSSP